MNNPIKNKKPLILLERYEITSLPYKIESSENEVNAPVHWYSAHDSLLDMDISLFQYVGEVDIDSILPVISSKTGVLDYFSIDNSTYVVSDNASIPDGATLPHTLSYSKLFIFIPIVIIAIILSFILLKNRVAVSDEKAIPQANETSDISTTVSDSPVNNSADEYMYDDSSFYRIVMYPLDNISDDDLESDINILKKRLDALCNGSEYEFKKIDNHLCVLIPIDSVSSLDSLKYLCKYYVASRFDVSNVDFYESDDDVSWYSLSSVSENDIKNVALSYQQTDSEILRKFCRVFPKLSEEDFPYKDSYPFVYIEYSDSYKQKMEHLLQDTTYRYSILGEVIDKDTFINFNLNDYKHDGNIIFPATIYTFSEPKYIENALNLLVADFSLGPLSSDYAYSVTTSGIAWDKSLLGKYQCTSDSLPNEYCYIDLCSDLLSDGKMIDVKKYICSVMDSLNIPYALGRIDYPDEDISHIYIACGYQNMGMPFMNMLSSFSSSYKIVSIYDGLYNLQLFDAKVATSDGSLIVSSSDNEKLLTEYLAAASERGTHELYLLVDDFPILKMDTGDGSFNGSLCFDELIYDCDNSECEWKFINALFASDSPCQLKLNGAELIPLDKTLEQLSNQFSIKDFTLGEDVIKKLTSVNPDICVSYGKNYNGNIYNIPQGKVYIDLNLDTDDSFASKSVDQVKKMSDICDMNDNPLISLITFTLTEESFTDFEQSKMSIFRHYIDLGTGMRILDTYDDMSLKDIIADARMDSGLRVPVDYVNHYLINFDDDSNLQANAGIYYAANMLGQRMHAYQDDFHNIIVNDSWFDYSDMLDPLWICNYDYYPFDILD